MLIVPLLKIEPVAFILPLNTSVHPVAPTFIVVAYPNAFNEVVIPVLNRA